MPKDRSDSRDKDSHREHHGKRRSKHRRFERHDDATVSSSMQESEDLYVAPETNSYSPQVVPINGSLTLSPVSQVFQERRAFRKRNSRSASSPVRQKYVYDPQEMARPAIFSSFNQAEGSVWRRFSIQSSHYDPDAELHKAMEDADSLARSRSRPETEEDERDDHAPTTPERGSRKPRPEHPPSSYSYRRHKHTPEKLEAYPPSLPSSTDVKDFAHNLQRRPRTRRSSHYESEEDSATLSASDYSQTTRTNTTTDLSHTAERTECATSRTVGTTDRSAKSEPGDTDRSEASTPGSIKRGISYSTDHRDYKERFDDLLYICPEVFRKNLETWEEYAARGHEAGQDLNGAIWFYTQRKRVMSLFQVLTDSCHPPRQPTDN